MLTIREWIVLLLPMIACFTASAVCPIGKNAGRSVVFRPPAWVFGIVWFCITIALGISWVLASKHVGSLPTWGVNTIYAAVVAFLVLWIIQYGCNDNKIAAMWTFVPLIMTALMCAVTGSTGSRLLVCPLIAWLLFAMLLGATELNQTV